VKSFTSENVAKLYEVNNNKKSRKRKVENKGHAVIQRGKMNLKLVTDDDIADGDIEHLFCPELFLAWSAWREMGPVSGE
jgi:hypothetical protein